MPSLYEIRADYNADTITVYQAYSKGIAESALSNGTFTAPFSFQRMTWIKPSFLWMMERSNWGLKSNQEHILAIRIKRSGWEEALSNAVLTHPDDRVYKDEADWHAQANDAIVRVQWDPERSINGSTLNYRSIQVGLSRHVIHKYVEDWIVKIDDITPLVRKMHRLIQTGQSSKAKSLLPKERVYPVSEETATRLGML